MKNTAASKNFTDYIDNMNIPPIMLKEVTETEINNIIKKMNTPKASGSTSIPIVIC